MCCGKLSLRPLCSHKLGGATSTQGHNHQEHPIDVDYNAHRITSSFSSFGARAGAVGWPSCWAWLCGASADGLRRSIAASLPLGAPIWASPGLLVWRVCGVVLRRWWLPLAKWPPVGGLPACVADALPVASGWGTDALRDRGAEGAGTELAGGAPREPLRLILACRCNRCSEVLQRSVRCSSAGQARRQ